MSTATNTLIHTSWVDPGLHIHRQLLHYQYESHLTESTQSNIKRVFQPQNEYGWTSLAFDIDGMSMKPKTARSYPSLLRKIEKEGYQYYRPNLSYTSQSHLKRKLRWMVGLFFDFDAKNLRVLGITQSSQLLKHIQSLGFNAYAIIQTTSGFHVYMPMQPLRGCWNGEKTIRRYDAVMKRIARMIGSDINAASAEHYFRTPQKSNVVYFDAIDKPSFEWYEEKVIEKVNKVLPAGDRPSFGRLMSQPAMLKILSGDFNTNAVVDGRQLGRNNAAFTLALGMKADGWTREQATQELHIWYKHRISRYDFSITEIDRVIRQAYEKDYQAPMSLYVEAMSGLKMCRYTKRVAEEDRKRMRFEQIQEALILYLQRYYQEFKRDLMMSQTKLAEELKVSLRSLQSVLKTLKDQELLTIDTKRIGRSNISIYFLATDLLKNDADAPESSVDHSQQVRPTMSTRRKSSGIKARMRAHMDLRVYATIHNAIPCTFLFAIGCLDLLNPFRCLYARDRYDE